MGLVSIKAEGLSKQYQVGELHARYDTLRDQLARTAKRLVHPRSTRDVRRDFWALQDVSFEVEQGELLGIIGRNGAGKTTLLKLLARITQPTRGYADVYGRLGSLLEVGTGFHPELTGRENIFLNGAILGMTRSEIVRNFDEIVDFAGVEKFIDTPVKRYSSGMSVRLAFSVAAHLEPEILLIDEALSVGDAEFQRKCLGKMESVGRAGRTVLFVSHNMQAITRLCERAIVLEGGRVVIDTGVHEAIATYLGSAHGRTAEREWPVSEAPGDEYARLRALRVVDSSLETAHSIDVRERVGIEFTFEVLKACQFVPWLEINDDQEQYVFGAFNTSEEWKEVLDPGRYTTVAWIPDNLLNEGTFLASASLRTFVAGTKSERHADARRAVSFQVYDRRGGDTAGGWYGTQIGGGVRPLLEWSTAREPLGGDPSVLVASEQRPNPE